MPLFLWNNFSHLSESQILFAAKMDQPDQERFPCKKQHKYISKQNLNSLLRKDFLSARTVSFFPFSWGNCDVVTCKYRRVRKQLFKSNRILIEGPFILETFAKGFSPQVVPGSNTHHTKKFNLCASPCCNELAFFSRLQASASRALSSLPLWSQWLSSWTESLLPPT